MKLFFTILGLLIVFAGLGQKNCTLKLDKDSIKVYACVSPNSRFKTIKSTFTVNSSLARMRTVLMDIDFYAAWQYKTVSARVLKKVSDRELIYYTEVAAPVLTSNRDFVIRLTVDQDPLTKGLIAEAVSIPEYLPHIEKIIRVPYSRARWTIQQAGAGQLKVEYTIDIDLGGSVPPWLVNLLAHQAPYETFKALREKIVKYKDNHTRFIGD